MSMLNTTTHTLLYKALDDAQNEGKNVYAGIRWMAPIIQGHPLSRVLAEGMPARHHIMAWWLVHSGHLDNAERGWSDLNPSQLTLALLHWSFVCHDASCGPSGRVPASKHPLVLGLTRHPVLKKVVNDEKAQALNKMATPPGYYNDAKQQRAIETWQPLFDRLDTSDFVQAAELFVERMRFPEGAAWAFIARAQRENATVLDQVLRIASREFRVNALDALGPPQGIARQAWTDPLGGWALLANTVPWDATTLLEAPEVSTALSVAKGLGMSVEDNGLSLWSRQTAHAMVAHMRAGGPPAIEVDASIFESSPGG